MTENRIKVLGQAFPNAATLTTLYSVPSTWGATPTNSAVVSTITACNQSATATSIRIRVSVAGAGVASKDYIAYDVPINGNETISFTLGVTLNATDAIQVYADLATVSFNAFGQEIS